MISVRNRDRARQRAIANRGNHNKRGTSRLCSIVDIVGDRVYIISGIDSWCQFTKCVVNNVFVRILLFDRKLNVSSTAGIPPHGGENFTTLHFIRVNGR